jgi:hypothetical protein
MEFKSILASSSDAISKRDQGTARIELQSTYSTVQTEVRDVVDYFVKMFDIISTFSLDCKCDCSYL